MNLYSLITSDPLAVLELLTVSFSLLYLLKLIVAPAREEEDYPAPRTEQGVWSLFSVGSLISTPKRSLSCQHLYNWL